MSEYDELVGKLRTYYGDDLACRMLLMDARHALEALAGEVETAKSQFKALQMVTSKEHEDTRAERDRLKAALETIAHDNVPREVFIVWRTDGSNSKHDKCQHMRMMYEDCGNCTALFARKALGDAS